MTDKAREKRDRALMLCVLQVLEKATDYAPMAGLNGQSLIDNVEAIHEGDDAFEDDSHALRLIRKLVMKGKVAEELLPRKPAARFTPAHLFFKLTADGAAWLNGTGAPDPDLHDDRVVD